MKATSSSSKKITSSKKEEVIDLSSFGVAESQFSYRTIECPEALKNTLKGERFTVMSNKETGNLFLRGNKGHLLSLSFDSVAAERSVVNFSQLELVENNNGYRCWRIK